jgi:polar amino acid transport system permease protein
MTTDPGAPKDGTQQGSQAGTQIKAVPARHPVRWIATIIVLYLVVALIWAARTNHNFEWGVIRGNLFDGFVLRGVLNTLWLTFLSMVVGVVLGTVLAVMRLSPVPVVSGVAWVYIWFFRGTPVFVQLLFWGSIAALTGPRISVGIPLTGPVLFHATTTNLVPPLVAAVLGLGLNEGAYMAEIVRAGIQAVDPGQTEAASALGMSRGKTLRRIVLPQAMRVIVPPTGNETIAMIKDTSLVAFVPYYELFFQLQAIGSRTFQLFPMLVAACLWYLAMTSVLMVGQHFLEKRYARGTRRSTDRAERKSLFKIWTRLPSNWGS